MSKVYDARRHQIFVMLCTAKGELEVIPALPGADAIVHNGITFKRTNETAHKGCLKLDVYREDQVQVVRGKS